MVLFHGYRPKTEVEDRLCRFYCVCCFFSKPPHPNLLLYLDDTFQQLQNDFMEKHYHHFEDVEENKLIYTDIFQQYVSFIRHIFKKLEDTTNA